jgi:hypothetical protein
LSKTPPKVPPIRVGDRCRIVTPAFVVRVGYPMDLATETRKVLEDRAAEIARFLGLLTIRPEAHKSVIRVARVVAYEQCKRLGWGGDKREIHRHTLPEFAGREFEVSGVRFVKTGVYCPADVWEGEYDPPALADVKTHRLLELPFCPGEDHGPLGWFNFLEIEAANVDRVN